MEQNGFWPCSKTDSKKKNVLNDLVLRDQNGRNGREINKIRKEINELLDCEEVMWQQRSKVQ